jgi:hypothetical protein
MSRFLTRFAWIPVLLLVLVMVSGLVLHLSPAALGADESSAKIEEAESAVQHGFRATLEAEGAGANVSGLLADLNVAGEFLSEAEMDYRSGNVTGASVEADAALSALNRVVAEASGLKSSAQANAQNVFTWDLAFLLVGSLTFLLGLIIVWMWFKRVYARGLLRHKPEVVSDVEPG